jgi:hypothetical protein
MSSIFIILFVAIMALLIRRLISSTGIYQHGKIEIKRINPVTKFGSLGIVLLMLVAITSPTTENTTVKNFNATTTSNKQTTSKKSHNHKKHHSTKKHTTKLITKTEVIAFTTSDQADSSLDKGITRIAQVGQNGVKSLIYKVAYTDSKQTSKKLVSAAITTQPVTQIVDIGTYVAPAPATPTTSPSSCHPLSDEGNCYNAGEYCRESDAGVTGIASNGESIICENNDGLRWEPN